MVLGVRCDVNIFKLTASAQSIYREVCAYIYLLFMNIFAEVTRVYIINKDVCTDVGPPVASQN